MYIVLNFNVAVIGRNLAHNAENLIISTLKVYRPQLNTGKLCPFSWLNTSISFRVPGVDFSLKSPQT